MTTRVALVTGASRGIGCATAIRLAADFTTVVVVARDAAMLAKTADAIRRAGATPIAIARDLRDPAAASQVCTEAMYAAGQLDALVNIAGAVPQADLFQLTDADWEDGLSLKFHAARRLTLACWAALKTSGGSVVLTSGTSAIVPKPAFAAVGAINAAIVALAKMFAERGLTEGVQVNSILPGPVLTGRRHAMLARYAESYGLASDVAAGTFAAESGIARFGKPEEIAHAIAFLPAPTSRWITGTAPRVDGGETKSV